MQRVKEHDCICIYILVWPFCDSHTCTYYVLKEGIFPIGKIRIKSLFICTVIRVVCLSLFLFLLLLFLTCISQNRIVIHYVHIRRKCMNVLINVNNLEDNLKGSFMFTLRMMCYCYVLYFLLVCLIVTSNIFF